MAEFLRLVPERLKKIAGSSDSDVEQAADYPVNRLAAEIHPGTQNLRIAKVCTLSADTKLYTLIPDPESGTASLAPFAPGQYISVRVEKDGRILSRPYSLASSPEEAAGNGKGDGVYEIAVRRIPSGEVSGHIHENWEIGTRVTVSEPMGEFTYERLRDAGCVVGIAGGVGITPFRSHIRSILRGGESFRLILLYGVRKEEDIIFGSELEEAAKSGMIRVVYVYSDEKKTGCESGFITPGLIRRYAPDSEYSVFACGPSSMYRFLEAELPALGLRRKYVRYDAKGQIMEPRGEPDYTPADGSEYSITVRRNGDGKTVKCHPDETVMSAIERGGIAVPSGCRSGECGYCHSRLVSGRCYIPASRDGRRQADKIYGYIHPCVSYPRSDLVIEVPPVPAGPSVRGDTE